MNKTTISIIIIVLVIIGSLFLFSGSNKTTEDETASSSQSTGIVIDAGRTVVIRGHQLPPNDIEIEVGTTILWENKDSFIGLPYNEHTITSGSIDRTGKDGVRGIVPNSGSGVSDGTFQEGLKLNKSFSYTFTEPGIYPFYIAEHPIVSGERKIIVAEISQSSSGETVAMEAKSFSFSPDALRATIGEVFALNITATGQHTFTIDELGIDVILPHGETTRVEITPEQTGSFQFYCSIPGHRGAGQVGTIVVE